MNATATNAEVKIGHIYVTRITDKPAAVRIIKKLPEGGWRGVNMQTNRPVHIKDETKLGCMVSVREARESDDDELRKWLPKRKSTKKEPVRALKKKPRIKAKAQPAKKPKIKAKATTKSAKKMSLIDAAYKALKKSGEALGTAAIYELVIKAKLWKPGAGKTPKATLNSAIHREIRSSRKPRRFAQAGAGKVKAL